MKTCARVRIEAEAALIEGSPLPSHVSAHLDGCPACRSAVAELTLLTEALSTLPTPSVPATLSATITAAVLADLAARRRPAPIFVRLFRPLTAAATAFAMVLGFVVVTGSALFVGAAWRSGESMPSQTVTAPAAEPSTATTTPATTEPSAPTAAPATEAPAAAATPSPEPTDLPRRTPEPASPNPSGDDSTDAPGSTNP